MSADPIELLRSRLENARPMGAGLTARCPAHEDRRNSLKVDPGKNGEALIHCHAGCPTERVVSALGLSMADLFPPRPEAVRGNGRGRRVVAAYDYRAAGGTPLYQVLRLDPKEFRQRRPDGRGGWLWNLDGVPRVLYRLPELAAADPRRWVLYVEGEKDADALAARGLVATTHAGGAGKTPTPATLEPLRGRRVAILPDNDAAGRAHAEAVARALAGIAAEVRVVALPGLPAKGDVSDWLAAGGDAEELRRLIVAAPRWLPAPGAAEPATDAAGSGGSAPVGVLVADVRPERLRWLSRGRLAAGKLTMLDGDPGLGKSTLLCDWAARITRGAPLPDGEPGEPRGVVLLSAEDGLADTIRPRLEAAGADLRRVYALTGVREPDGGERLPAIPDDLPAAWEAIRAVDAALLVVDPLVAYLGGGVNSRQDQDVRRALAPLKELAEASGVAVVGVRHLNKSQVANALYRGGGSIGIIGAARFGLLVAADPDDPERRILASTKSNLGKPPPSLAYRLESVPGTDVARVAWEERPAAYTADDLLAPALDGDERGEREEAAEWLADYLAGGSRPAEKVYQDGRKAGHSDRTLRRAKKALGVRSTKTGFGHEGAWAWALPDHELAGAGLPVAGSAGPGGDADGKGGHGSLSGPSPKHGHLSASLDTLAPRAASEGPHEGADGWREGAV